MAWNKSFFHLLPAEKRTGCGRIGQRERRARNGRCEERFRRRLHFAGDHTNSLLKEGFVPLGPPGEEPKRPAQLTAFADEAPKRTGTTGEKAK